MKVVDPLHVRFTLILVDELPARVRVKTIGSRACSAPVASVAPTETTGVSLSVIVPLAAMFLQRAPEPASLSAPRHAAREPADVLGWPPKLVFAALCAAIFMCCVPMSMPQSHLVAFCSDLGISKAHGAAMLSVLLGTAFLCRQIWGLICDGIGGFARLAALAIAAHSRN